MPKRSKEQIEQDENKILEELQKNANESINQIAKKCGFSRQKVWRIIKRLEKNNTIWGYVTIVDNERQGKEEFTMLIKRTNKPSDKKLLDTIVNRKVEEIAKKINVQIESSYYIHGNYDWMICFTADNIKQAKKLAESMNTTFSGYLEEIHLLQRMFPIKKLGVENPDIEKLKEFTTI
jgi:DNA-binding Lrp family transcriptional regulator